MKIEYGSYFEYMPKNNISQNTPEYIPPDSALESFARRILPAIQAYYDSEEGQREFEKWKRKREEHNNQNSTTTK